VPLASSTLRSLSPTLLPFRGRRGSETEQHHDCFPSNSPTPDLWACAKHFHPFSRSSQEADVDFADWRCSSVASCIILVLVRNAKLPLTLSDEKPLNPCISKTCLSSWRVLRPPMDYYFSFCDFDAESSTRSTVGRHAVRRSPIRILADFGCHTYDIGSYRELRLTRAISAKSLSQQLSKQGEIRSYDGLDLLLRNSKS
jgi:hypothetical protein